MEIDTKLECAKKQNAFVVENLTVWILALPVDEQLKSSEPITFYVHHVMIILMDINPPYVWTSSDLTCTEISAFGTQWGKGKNLY